MVFRERPLFTRLPALREKFAHNWQIWCQSVNLLAEIQPPFLLADLVAIIKSAGKTNPNHPLLPADLVTVNLPADLVPVSKSVGRFGDSQKICLQKSPPISAGRFGDSQ